MLLNLMFKTKSGGGILKSGGNILVGVAENFGNGSANLNQLWQIVSQAATAQTDRQIATIRKMGAEAETARLEYDRDLARARYLSYK
jgi:hypothetical protein